MTGCKMIFEFFCFNRYLTDTALCHTFITIWVICCCVIRIIHSMVSFGG